MENGSVVQPLWGIDRLIDFMKIQHKKQKQSQKEHKNPTFLIL